jgi:aminotransferase
VSSSTRNAAGVSSARAHQVCVRCVMDTTDPEIEFDSEGVCSHCHGFEVLAARSWLPNEAGERQLSEIVDRLKAEGRGKDYDCILGLSGGVDSSYLALKMSERGLRMLAVHVDAGWNSETAVHNIERIVETCGLELFTHVVNWEDMRELQVAYLRAGLANQDVPQDHIYFSTLYRHATKNKIRFVLNGGNIATEAVFPRSWLGNALDARSLKAIHRQFGTRKLKDYETVSFSQYYIRYPYLKRMKVLRPLNLMPYVKADAIAELESKVGYKPYPRKHGESLFTCFFQNHYLPDKFGFDHRLPHLSTLILSGQMTREQALVQLEEPLYEPADLARDKAFIAKKLRLTSEEFEDLLRAPAHRFEDFPNQTRWYQTLKRVQTVAERITRRNLSNYG